MEAECNLLISNPNLKFVEMEDRKNIHEQIADMLERISQANKSLSNSKRLLSVEIDLLKTYNKELATLIDKLENSDSMPSAEPVQEPVVINKAPEPAPEPEFIPGPATEVEMAEPEPTPEPILEEEVKQPEPETEPEPVAEVQAPQPVPEPEPEPVAELEKPQPEPKPQAAFHVDDEEEEVSYKHENKEPEKPSLNDRFKRDEGEELGYRVGYKVGRNLKDMIDLSEKFEYARELFNGDTDYFERTLRYLNSCKDLHEAETYVEQEVKSKYNWAGKEKIENKFTRLLRQRFN